MDKKIVQHSFGSLHFSNLSPQLRVSVVLQPNVRPPLLEKNQLKNLQDIFCFQALHASRTASLENSHSDIIIIMNT